MATSVDTVVDANFRNATRRNHTATHLLHAALREVLGTHVKQAGSLVDPNRLRFDFSHFTAIADEELQDIEDIINKQSLENTKVETLEDVPIDVAVNEYHAMALFGEKYGEKVRVVQDRRLLDGAVRRHAHRRDRRDWRGEAAGRGLRVVGSAARGSGDRAWRAE